jgi:hypothetical protein
MKRRKLLNDGQKKWVTLAFQITLDIDDGWKVCYTGEEDVEANIMFEKKIFG